MAKGTPFDIHDFYCLNCGRRNLPLARSRSLQHKGGHRKNLYCIYCKKEVNHIEIRTQQEKDEFLENFNKGLYKEEAEESIRFNEQKGRM